MISVISASRFTFSISKSTKLCSCSRSRVWPSSSLSLRSRNRNSNLFSSASMSESAESNSAPPPDDIVEKAADVLIQYVVLRRDLIDSWPLGSVVTQGCHASVSAIWLNKDDPQTSEYCSPHNIDSMHKVTLEVKGETQIVNLSEKLKENSIAHKLWIEQPENIPTCLATKPYPKSVVSAFFKKLKLCK
ncbi:putative peptidyl-tRNA hydrolase PTRHD1 [Cucurbita maxima]|uniref:peptidyl-tRNA hydrolase n=1 Tax=Cucurbita maxima TaxID=3661 RepID=A0A6J1K304_CUCMA|nr:putative peptidyl-tRNA hydrolase PTRHD1 [Cucurbita maxima]